MEDNHHIYHTRRNWNEYKLSNQIRNDERSQIILPVEIHRELHANTHGIVVPSAFVARLALERITTRNRRYSTLDVVRDSEDYLRAVGEQYHDDAIEIADRLLEQIPYLQLGANALKRTTLL